MLTLVTHQLYHIMMKKVIDIDYLLSNDLAAIPKRGRRELKSIVIENKKFRYNKDKPISTVLTKKLLTVEKTNEYRNMQSETNLGSKIFNQHLQDIQIQYS